MGPLVHVFLPLLAAYVLFPDAFTRRRYLALGGLGLFADVDKFLGVPGLFHSLMVLGPLTVMLVGVDSLRGDEAFGYGALSGAFLLSHLILDVLDGGPVPLFAPFVETGIGLHYPARIVFGEGMFGVTISGSLVALTADTPRTGFNGYGFVDGFGVASVLLFVFVYLSLEFRRRARAADVQRTTDLDRTRH